MPPNRLLIRKVAIMGASLMGAQLAALFVNAGFQTLLFDLASKEGDPNALVKEAILSLKSLKPSPFASLLLSEMIVPANYEHDLSLLKDCDLIIETISERLDWKLDLYKKIENHLSDNSFLLSNLSGLSIEKLARGLKEGYRSRFLGVHFFTPIREISLVEFIPHNTTDKALLEQLESFFVSHLGKNIIYCKESPNFIATRLSTFLMLSVFSHAEIYGITPDVVDLIMEKTLGWPNQPLFKNLDKMGLDVFAKHVQIMQDQLINDPWHFLYHLPNWIKVLIHKGFYGNKVKAGIYKYYNHENGVVDKQGQYRPLHSKLSPELLQLLQLKNLTEKLALLRASDLAEAKFIWAVLRDLFHYAAYHLRGMAETVRDVDLALIHGCRWSQGPFELWQTIGWTTVIQWIEEDNRLKRDLVQNNFQRTSQGVFPPALPAWVYDLGIEGPYKNNTAFSPNRRIYLSRTKLPVYERQIFKDKLIGETEELGKTIFENNDLRMWSMDDDIAIVSFKTKKHMITTDILEGIQEAIKRAEVDYSALILWQNEDQEHKDFSLGFNLNLILDYIDKGRLQDLSNIVKLFQQTSLKLRYAEIPTIAAVRGKVIGGACELMMHCTRIVAAQESYPGLLELKMGMIPAGAGSKEIALRASSDLPDIDSFQIIQSYFKTLTEGPIATSALHAKQLGYLRESDVIVMNAKEVLFVAKQLGKFLSLCHYHPPLKRKISAIGKSGTATLQVHLINLRESGLITDHDYITGSGFAHVICGGDVEGGMQVSEEWLLELERELFIDLIQTKKTQERLGYLLDHGLELA